MRKKITCFILILSTLLIFYPSGTAYAAETSSELNIYAMYLGSDDKGDSVLLESEGEYLLIDIGASSSVPAIIQQLNALGATHVSIMFSHLHKDHIGASGSDNLSGLRQLTAAGITIDTLYLANPDLIPLSLTYPAKYEQLSSYISLLGTSQIVYLNVGDRVKVGDATGEIIGPLNTDKLTPSMYASLNTDSSTNNMYVRYENNCSLVAIFTCGTTRYFTAGDIFIDQASYLSSAYGYSLDCDIMKLCHHGNSSGNSKALLGYAQPAFSFATNSGVELYSSSGQWKTYTSSSRAANYGMVYLIGNERKTIIYHIVNDEITLYRGSTISSNTQMTGWQKLYGSDGVNRQYDMYYLDENSTPLTGVQTIGNHSYLFTSGGQMDYGSYDIFGQYQGWKTYSTGSRYYELSANGDYAYMSTGFTQIGENTYYFDSDGLLFENTGNDTVLKKIGSDYYAFWEDNSILQDDWENFDSGTRYFDESGKMLKNCVCKIDGNYYMFDSNGIRKTSKSGVSLAKLGSQTYAVRKNGTLVTGKCAKINGKKYYFDKTGVMLKNAKIKYKGKTYYSNANGVLSTQKPSDQK